MFTTHPLYGLCCAMMLAVFVCSACGDETFSVEVEVVFEPPPPQEMTLHLTLWAFDPQKGPDASAIVERQSSATQESRTQAVFREDLEETLEYYFGAVAKADPNADPETEDCSDYTLQEVPPFFTVDDQPSKVVLTLNARCAEGS